MGVIGHVVKTITCCNNVMYIDIKLWNIECGVNFFKCEVFSLDYLGFC